MDFSHFDSKGNAVMVNISQKPVIKRTAKATGKIRMHPDTIRKIRDKLIKKGDVLTVAKIAGITGGKRTSDLIPLCHNISIDQITVECSLHKDYIEITGCSICTDKTGIEMEALTSVSIAALTIYDMCKAADKKMEITGIRLLEKTKEHI
ncbi:MAG: cyclic pyranopterin monophosphate synthase MoaC [Spirochaetes bacterium]|nr:cyclic pyranopterin monophosphate synthase MoaC [Spirochaetota bacterium]